MQKAKVFFLKTVHCVSNNPYKKTGKKSEWDFRFTPIYMIAILDFQYNKNEEHQKFLRLVDLKN